MSANSPAPGSDPCDELLRLGITLSPDAANDAAACARTLQWVTRGRVPALPGVAGFEIRDMGDGSPRDLLFEERDDPEWARPMEGRILQESSQLLDFPLITLHAVCRSATCGMLFVYSSDDYHGGSYNYYAQELADTLGFEGFFGGSTRGMDGIGVTTIYLGNWKTERPDL